MEAVPVAVEIAVTMADTTVEDTASNTNIITIIIITTPRESNRFLSERSTPLTAPPFPLDPTAMLAAAAAADTHTITKTTCG